MVRSLEGRRLSLLLAGVLLCSVAAPAVTVSGTAPGAGPDAEGPASGTAPGSVSTASVGAPTLLQGFEADRTSFRVTVYENGSAEWLFRYEKSLNDSERADFEAFAEEFDRNETELFVNFRERARWLADNGSTATGREMSAESFRRDAGVEGLDPQTQALGVVEMSFRWQGFARVADDGRVVAGDVFEGGLYIGSDQELVFVAGPNLTFDEARPDDGDRVVSAGTLADSESVTWTGEKSFTDQRPRVVLTDAGDATGETGTAPSSTATPTGTGSGWLLPAGVLVVVLVLGTGAAVAYRNGVFAPTDGDGGAAVTEASGDDDGGTAATGADADAESPAAVTEAELLSDEERVVNLLEDNGGRMKQVDIVEETDWSKSKVSMLLSDMEDEEHISKLRVGRENIVSLTGHEPDAAGSPFDDEE
jgi:hypothetical protein